MPNAHLTLLRHGESVWNQQNRFTGWEDVALSENGRREAQAAAVALHAADVSFDIALSSYLRRAIHTLWLVLEEMDLMWLPQKTDWRLNERHYGALQGLNKAETAQQYGAEQVHQWRRSYDIAPPPSTAVAAVGDNRYAAITPPLTESLKDVMPRVQAAYEENIAPLLRARKRVLVVAHGNSLRALVKQLEDISDTNISNVEIRTGVPLHYELNAELKPQAKHFLL